MKIERCESVEEWCIISNEFDNTKSLLIERLEDKKFSDEEILDILHVLDNTCMRCHDGDYNCQCWNDE